MHLVVRTANAPASIVPDLRRIFGELDKTLPFRTPEDMEQVVSEALTLQRLENWAFATFAVLALVLALIGLYGLISHGVELSRRDIGIRIAVAASRGRIFKLVYKRVGGMLAIGVAGGLAGVWAARQLIATVVPVQAGRDAETLIALTGLFTTVSLAAAFLPARRAATVDPMQSLRVE
jgi:putative ABC transport system permease protein